MKISNCGNCFDCQINDIRLSLVDFYNINKIFEKSEFIPSDCVIKLLSKISKNKWKWFIENKISRIPCRRNGKRYKELIKLINGSFELE